MQITLTKPIKIKLMRHIQLRYLRLLNTYINFSSAYYSNTKNIIFQKYEKFYLYVFGRVAILICEILKSVQVLFFNARKFKYTSVPFEKYSPLFFNTTTLFPLSRKK